MSKSKKIVLTLLKCLRCLHEWVPRKATIRICPKCKHHKWNEPREVK
jgi:hypothetical protein